MNNEQNEMLNNNVIVDENVDSVVTQYVDEFGNPIDPSLIDENGNYIGETTPQYVDEYGNPIDPSLIDENGNYIGPQTADTNTINQEDVASALNDVQGVIVSSSSEHQMDDKELLQGMVTFDYNNVPITDIVNSIILDAINKGASDIHFDPFDDGIKIRVRIDGELNDYSIVPLFVKKNMITRVKIISGMNITETRVPQDGAIRTELANKTIDLRVSCLPTNMGEKIVIRIMDYSMSASGVEALDFSEKNLEKVQKMLKLPNGIILVTGATGSGKSTTVYSMLQKLNVEGTNLVTVEDPIEMNIGGVNQVQAISEIGLDFATVLRSILRQDPDVIMIGEIRDDETARIAVRASITGHLVLSTIHTNNSLNTIERLTDMSVERYLLGTALSGVVSQKLARRLCEKCKRLRPTNDYEKETFKKVLNKDIAEIYEPVGCPECSRGYRGRIAIQEVLLLNTTIQDAITKGVDKNILRQLVYGENGTETMLQDGLEKVLQGKTSFDEIIKLIDLEDDLGSGTQLGLEDQIDASLMTNNQVNGAINLGNNPININITPELLQGLNGLSNLTSDDDDDEEVIIKPKKTKKKRKKVVEVEVADDDDEEIESLEEEPAVVIESAPKKTKSKSKKSKKDKEEPAIKIEEPVVDTPAIEIKSEDNLESLDDFEENSNLQSLDEFEENINLESLDDFEENQNLESLDDFEEKEIEVKELESEEIPTLEVSNIEVKEDEISLEEVIKEFRDNLKNIGKKKFINKTKDLVSKLIEFDIDNQQINDVVKDYAKSIKETSKIKLEAKEELIDLLNRNFGLNEVIDPIDELASDTIATLDDIDKETSMSDIERKIDRVLDLKNQSLDDITLTLTPIDDNKMVDIDMSKEDTITDNIDMTLEPIENENMIDIDMSADDNIELSLESSKDEKYTNFDENLDDGIELTLEPIQNENIVDIDMTQNVDEISAEDIEDADFTNIDNTLVTSLIDSLNENTNEDE